MVLCEVECQYNTSTWPIIVAVSLAQRGRDSGERRRPRRDLLRVLRAASKAKILIYAPAGDPTQYFNWFYRVVLVQLLSLNCNLKLKPINSLSSRKKTSTEIFSLH